MVVHVVLTLTSVLNRQHRRRPLMFGSPLTEPFQQDFSVLANHLHPFLGAELEEDVMKSFTVSIQLLQVASFKLQLPWVRIQDLEEDVLNIVDYVLNKFCAEQTTDEVASDVAVDDCGSDFHVLQLS